MLESQFRPALNREVISFPAGLMDPEDNDIKETAIREVKEETGYDVFEMRRIKKFSFNFLIIAIVTFWSFRDCQKRFFSLIFLDESIKHLKLI